MCLVDLTAPVPCEFLLKVSFSLLHTDLVLYYMEFVLEIKEDEAVIPFENQVK